MSSIKITSLDNIDGHCGTFLTDGESRACIDGGLDIATNGEVKSPISGTVVLSRFDKGVPNYHGSTCNPNNLPDDQFCYPALGGVVYIKNAAGYEIALLHLAKDGLRGVGSISRGESVGQTYVGKICDSVDPSKCTTSGTHVHYQVRRNGGSIDFRSDQGKLFFPPDQPPSLGTSVNSL